MSVPLHTYSFPMKICLGVVVSNPKANMPDPINYQRCARTNLNKVHCHIISVILLPIGFIVHLSTCFVINIADILITSINNYYLHYIERQ